MRKKLLLLAILSHALIFFTAFYIVVNSLKQIYATKHLKGEYNLFMNSIDRMYISIHKIEITWLIVVFIALGIAIDELIRWASRK